MNGLITIILFFIAMLIIFLYASISTSCKNRWIFRCSPTKAGGKKLVDGYFQYKCKTCNKIVREHTHFGW